MYVILLSAQIDLNTNNYYCNVGTSATTENSF